MMVNKLTHRLQSKILILLLLIKRKKKAEEGYDPEYGARPLIRAIQKRLKII